MFTIKKLAAKNLLHRKFQSAVIFFFLFITTIGTFAGGLLEYSMREGLAVTASRIGADVIVVPDRFVTSVEDALFKGKACTVNFDASWQAKINQVEGIKSTSTQLYLASASEMECCDDTVQIIAVDMASDFTIGPWLSERGITDIAVDEIIVGCNLGKKKGDTVKYFGRSFQVRAELDETGMGYDSCVFLSYEAAYDIAGDSTYARLLPFSKEKKVISMVLIDVAEGNDITTVSQSVKENFGEDEIAVYEVTSMLGTFADKVKQFQIFGTFAEGLVLVLATISLFSIVVLTLSLRLNEFGSLLSVGITKKKISRMVFFEYFYLIIAAAVMGIIICSITIWGFHMAIRQLLDVPYHTVPQLVWLGMCGKVLALDFGVCGLGMVYSLYRIRIFQPAELVKELV